MILTSVAAVWIVWLLGGSLIHFGQEEGSDALLFLTAALIVATGLGWHLS